MFAFVSLCLFLSVSCEYHRFPAILVFFLSESLFLTSVSGSCLLFLFVLFVSCFKMFYCVCFSVCSLVCFESQYYIFSLHLVLLLLFLVFVVLVFSFF